MVFPSVYRNLCNFLLESNPGATRKIRVNKGAISPPPHTHTQTPGENHPASPLALEPPLLCQLLLCHRHGNQQAGLQGFPIPAKAGGWGEMARLIPNPGKAMTTFHRNSGRRPATALLEKIRKENAAWLHGCGVAFALASFCCARLRAAGSGPAVLIPLASPIMLLCKQPTGVREVCNLGRGTSRPKPACCL